MADPWVDAVKAAVLEFRVRAGATRVTVLLDRGDGTAAVIDALQDGGVDVDAGPDEPGEEPGVAAVPEVPDMKPIPPLLLTRTDEGVDLPLVQLAYLAGHLRSFVAGLGGLSVATAQFRSSDPERPLAISARTGEPLLVMVGRDMYPLPEGWPD